mgnify:FL=1
MVLPIKFQSSMKDENISCVKSLLFSGYTSKTAVRSHVTFDLAYDGSISVTRRNENEKQGRVNVQHMQMLFNEFETLERVRNSRDNSEKPYKMLGEKQRAFIDRGRIFKKKYEIPERIYGVKFIEAKYFLFMLTNGARLPVSMSEIGFEYAWQMLKKFITQASLTP